MPAASLKFAPGLFCAAMFAAVPAAQAYVVTQTEGIVGSNSYHYTSFGNMPGVAKTITATFDKFDASLGSLTGVSFGYDYDYDYGNRAGQRIGRSPLRFESEPEPC